MHIIYSLTHFLFSLFQCSVDAGKHGESQQIVARLPRNTLSVSYTQGRRKQIISRLSLNCHLEFHACSHTNL